MSIAEEITRIQSAKENLKSAINGKGGTLADETLDHYAQAVTDLPDQGTDTSDATVTAEDILYGKKAYGANGKITGTHTCIDTSSATVTAEDIRKGEFAFGADGSLIVGTHDCSYDASDTTATREDIYYDKTAVIATGKVSGSMMALDPWQVAAGVKHHVIHMGGVGTFTGDATATNADIRDGKTAGINGKMEWGTMPEHKTLHLAVDPGEIKIEEINAYVEQVSYSANKLNISGNDIRAGFSHEAMYDSGTFTGDATASAADILKGKTAGVNGEMVTGTLDVFVSTFYQCTSVDKENKTWTGKKAVFSDGFYSFEEDDTTGLPFGSGYTPVVGKIYDTNGFAVIDKLFTRTAVPLDGLVFYLPFNGNADPMIGSVTGSTGELTYGEASGIGYAVFDGTQQIIGKPDEELSGDYSLAVTFMCNDVSSSGSQYLVARSVAPENPVPPPTFLRETAFFYGMAYGSNKRAHTLLEAGRFYSAIATFEASTRTLKLRQNELGFYMGTDSEKYHPVFGDASLYIGSSNISSNFWKGCILDVALWNRVLTADECDMISTRAENMNG